jgi:phage terminase large subunit
LTELIVPKILDIPEKLVPIITDLDNYRYFLLEGGRGGGKSQSVGRFILYLSEHYNIRIVCGRETQNSITESVYSLLVDLIRKYNLAFDVFSTKIVHKVSGTTINFRGFREQGAFNIQGLEGIDIVWIDEAQAITKQTLDVLIPTIRKDKAKIFFTMNRHVVDDPVYEFCDRRDDCLHIQINYSDNKFCTQALIREAEECKKKSIEDYNHIWLGEPLDKSEDAVFSFESLNEARRLEYEPREGYGYRIAGFDIARYGDDKCAAVIIQQVGALQWDVVHVEEWAGKDLNYSTGRILNIAAENRVDKAIIDEDGIGSGPLDSLQKGRSLEYFIGFRNPSISYSDNKDYANYRTVNTYKLREMINAGHLRIPDDGLIKELMTFKYTFDHNQRKILISKDQMRTKYKIKSPNMADALIMAVSLITEVKEKQDHQYVRRSAMSKEENLFGIAGIR